MPNNRAGVAAGPRKPRAGVADAGAGNEAGRGILAPLLLKLPWPSGATTLNNSSGRAWQTIRGGKRSESQAAYALVLEAAQKAGWQQGQQFQKPRLSFYWFLPNNHERDWNSLVEAIKYYQDSLTAPNGRQKFGLGIIANDSLKIIGIPNLSYTRFGAYTGEPGVWIEIREEGASDAGSD